MSQVEVDKIIPQSGTTLTIGDSGDTIAIASGATLSGSISGITNLTISGDLTVDTNTLKVDSTNNRVGILTSSPAKTLQVVKSNDYALRVGASDYHWDLGSISGSSPKLNAVGTSTSAIFEINGSEKMRIDSSGNLLVGTTANTPGTTTGVRLYEDGRGFFTADGNYAGYFNRLTSDGDLALFRKDGTTVGSIGVNSDRIYLTNANEGIAIDDSLNEIFPCNNAGNTLDNTISLGDDGRRFKDLYLSGGVYLGGTAAENKLDDYEEGTWSPSILIAGGSGSVLTSENEYVKVGRLVTIACRLRVNNFSSATGAVTIGGTLPFTPDHGFIIKPSNRALDFDGDAHLKINDADTTIYTRTTYDQDISDTNNEVSTTDGRTIKVLEFSATYQTTA